MFGANTFRTRITVSAAMCALTVFLGYFARRADFGVYITAYTAFFGLYVFVLTRKYLTNQDIRWYTGLGLFLRVLLLFSIPNFSDDVYRFLWDGHLLVQGIHPFAHVPAYFIEHQIAAPGLTPELFGKLNSPSYYTVYPPVCQAVFGLAAWLFPVSIFGGVFVMKLFLLGCEVALPSPPQKGGGVSSSVAHTSGSSNDTDELARNLEVGSTELKAPSLFGGLGGAVWARLAWALNPLAIVELVGNCHFEGVMIFFLLTGIFALKGGRVNRAGIFFALATATKLLPLLFLPIVWRYLGWRRGWRFCIVFGLACMVLFVPILDIQVLQNMASSINLYFRQFQFNASVYYLLSGIGGMMKGYDVGRSIGPWLGFATMAGVVVIAFFTKPERASKSYPFDLSEALLWASMLHLSFSATVHAWYITVPLALSLLTRWRFALLWSGLIGLSYSHYSGGVYLEKYWLIALEYSILWMFILWEISRRHSLPLSPVK